MNESDLQVCGTLLKDQKLTIAFAESATAGRVTAEFSLLDDAGSFLKGGFACYDVCLKEDALNVPKALIERYTPESAEVTAAIAIGLSKLIAADIHIGITGLTAPGGSETASKPVGTMFIHAIRFGNYFFSDRVVFTGPAKEIVSKTVYHTAKLLIHHMKILN